MRRRHQHRDSGGRQHHPLSDHHLAERRRCGRASRPRPRIRPASIIAADITFTSSNPSIATISTGGLICGGVWDSSIINCNATIGQAGVGQVTITATSGNVTATVTVYVHLKVDRVVVNPLSGCTTMGRW